MSNKFNNFIYFVCSIELGFMLGVLILILGGVIK